MHNNQQQRRNRSPFRSNGSIIVTSLACCCCFFISIAGIFGLFYSAGYFSDYIETSATVVGTREMGTFEHSDEKLDIINNDFNAQFCPQVQFFTIEEEPPQNISTVLVFDCKEKAEDIELGEVVEILYDPSDPEDIFDATVPKIIEIAMICAISVSAMCSCCYVVVGVIFYRLAKAKRNRQQNVAANPHANHSVATSVQMTNLNGDENTRSQYATADRDAGYSNNSCTTPVECPQAAVPATPLEVHAHPEERDGPPLVAVYPEGTPVGTAIAVGDETPPIVGCTLIPSTTTTPSSNQTYVSPSTLPVQSQTPNSAYVSPSDIQEATVSA